MRRNSRRRPTWRYTPPWIGRRSHQVISKELPFNEQHLRTFLIESWSPWVVTDSDRVKARTRIVSFLLAAARTAPLRLSPSSARTLPQGPLPPRRSIVCLAPRLRGGSRLRFRAILRVGVMQATAGIPDSALPNLVLKPARFLPSPGSQAALRQPFLSLCTEAGARRNETNGFHKTSFSQSANFPFLTLQRARAITMRPVDARPA